MRLAIPLLLLGLAAREVGAQRDSFWSNAPKLPTAADSTWRVYHFHGFSLRHPRESKIDTGFKSEDSLSGIKLIGPDVTLMYAHPDTDRGYTKPRTGPAYELKLVYVPNASRRPIRVFVDSMVAAYNRRADEDYQIGPAERVFAGSVPYQYLDMRCGDCEAVEYFGGAGAEIIRFEIVYDISIPGDRERQRRLYLAILATLRKDP